MKPVRMALSLAALTGTAIGLSALSTAPPGRDAIYRGLVGNWEGSLTYKDYSPPYGMVTLPTRLEVRYAPDSTAVLIDYTYDDGPGKIVTDHDRFAMNTSGTRLEWDTPGVEHPREFTVDSFGGGSNAGPLVLVASTEADDDHAPATLRETFTIGADTLRILKTVRPIGGTFSFRHAYLLHRAP